jgi:hypothetical protein
MPTYDTGIEGQLNADSVKRNLSTSGPLPDTTQLYSLAFQPPLSKGIDISTIDQLFVFMRSLENASGSDADQTISLNISEVGGLLSKVLPKEPYDITIFLRPPFDLNNKLAEHGPALDYLYELARLERAGLTIANKMASSEGEKDISLNATYSASEQRGHHHGGLNK